MGRVVNGSVEHLLTKAGKLPRGEEGGTLKAFCPFLPQKPLIPIDRSYHTNKHTRVHVCILY